MNSLVHEGMNRMKITDTHPSAAEHFDYLDEEPADAPQPVPSSAGAADPSAQDAQTAVEAETSAALAAAAGTRRTTTSAA